MTYTPPSASYNAVAGIDFSTAKPIAASIVSMLASEDSGAAKEDPSNCAQILQFPSKAVFWSSKLAVDADGVKGTELDPADGQNDTTYHVGGHPLDSTKHPFAVLPLGNFREETGLELGDVFVLVYKSQITAGLFGDLGPAHKLGEGSIRLHEGIMPAAPECCHRDSGGNCTRIIDISIDRDVLFFAFPGSAIDPSTITSSNLEELVKSKAYMLFANLHSSAT